MTQTIQAEEYFIKNESYYEAVGDEIAIFEAAAYFAEGANRLQ